MNLLRKGNLSRPQDVAEVERLWKTIGSVYIPTAPTEVAVGIPADLLRRRPDVRRAERQAAAQGEQIGIAEAALYPAFSVDGTLGFQAKDLGHLFSSQAFNGSVGPAFHWDLLNYGRLVNNIRFQDATFQELVLAYQNAVLTANQEVEDGLVSILAEPRACPTPRRKRGGWAAGGRRLPETAPGRDHHIQPVCRHRTGPGPTGRLWAQARGQIALGLIQVYRALGGGWQIRLEGEEAMPAVPAVTPVNPPRPQDGYSEAGDLTPSRLPGESRATAVRRAADSGTRAAATTPVKAATQPESAGWSRRKDSPRPAAESMRRYRGVDCSRTPCRTAARPCVRASTKPHGRVRASAAPYWSFRPVLQRSRCARGVSH